MKIETGIIYFDTRTGREVEILAFQGNNMALVFDIADGSHDTEYVEILSKVSIPLDKMNSAAEVLFGTDEE